VNVVQAGKLVLNRSNAISSLVNYCSSSWSGREIGHILATSAAYYSNGHVHAFCGVTVAPWVVWKSDLAVTASKEQWHSMAVVKLLIPSTSY
jgi:hypothetical protein